MIQMRTMDRPRHGWMQRCGRVLFAGALLLQWGCGRCGNEASAPRDGGTEAGADAGIDVVRPSSDPVVEPIDPHSVHGANKKLVHPVAVFLDGEQIAVLREGELPPGLPVRDNAFEGFDEKRYYSLAEYLQGIGVPIETVTTIHMAGHRDHIASIEGTELRKQPLRFVFDFGRTLSAMPKSCWATTGMKNQLRIDTIRNVAVFSKKPAPTLDPKLHCYVGNDGKCGPAYDPKTATAKGTRVYVDGKFAAFVKRRALGESSAKDTTEEGVVYGLRDFLKGLGIAIESVRGIELLTGDDLVGRVPQGALQRDTITFEVKKHAHGRIVARVPADVQANATDAKNVPVTSIQVFVKSKGTDRRVVPITPEHVAAASELGAAQTEIGLGSDTEED
jgi:hypothetical protein